jgi:sugar lactone lactonase YvrE
MWRADADAMRSPVNRTMPLERSEGKPAGGFKAIPDLDFGPDGSLYVQHATGPVFFAGPGDVIRVAPNGTRTVVISRLNRPTSLIIDWDGTIYVTNNGIFAGSDEVLQIRQ